MKQDNGQRLAGNNKSQTMHSLSSQFHAARTPPKEAAQNIPLKGHCLIHSCKQVIPQNNSCTEKVLSSCLRKETGAKIRSQKGNTHPAWNGCSSYTNSSKCLNLITVAISLKLQRRNAPNDISDPSLTTIITPEAMIPPKLK